MTGGGGAAEVTSSPRTMFGGIPVLPGRLVLMLLLLLSASQPRLCQACPGLLASTGGCSCGIQAAGKRVSCSGEELTEPPDASLMPNRTVTL